MKFIITESEKNTIREMYGLVTEAIQFGGVSADVSGGSIIFNKGGTKYTYKLEADTFGPNVSVYVNKIFNENGILKMEYSHIGGKGMSDLGDDNLNKIISQIPKSQITFTTDKGQDMILNKV